MNGPYWWRGSGVYDPSPIDCPDCEATIDPRDPCPECGYEPVDLGP